MHTVSKQKQKQKHSFVIGRVNNPLQKNDFSLLGCESVVEFELHI